MKKIKSVIARQRNNREDVDVSAQYELKKDSIVEISNDAYLSEMQKELQPKKGSRPRMITLPNFFLRVQSEKTSCNSKIMGAKRTLNGLTKKAKKAISAVKKTEKSLRKYVELYPKVSEDINRGLFEIGKSDSVTLRNENKLNSQSTRKSLTKYSPFDINDGHEKSPSKHIPNKSNKINKKKKKKIDKTRKTSNGVSRRSSGSKVNQNKEIINSSEIMQQVVDGYTKMFEEIFNNYEKYTKLADKVPLEKIHELIEYMNCH